METVTLRNATPDDVVECLLDNKITPIKVFDNHPTLWKPITIDPSRPPRRNGGTGLIGLHLDFINASNPPDYAAFWCEKVDEGGGGQNIIADVRDIPVGIRDGVERLPLHHGAFYDLSNVGHGLDWFYPFQDDFVRYGDGLSFHPAYKTLTEWLWDRIHVVDLGPGDALIVNQHTHVHGRLPVHGTQRVVQSIYGRA